MGDPPVFYLYHRKSDGRPFYYNAENSVTSWRPPEQGTVYDPDTLDLIPPSSFPSSHSNRHHRPRSVPPAIPSNLHLPPTLDRDAGLHPLEELSASLFRPAKGVSTADLITYHTKEIAAPLLSSVPKASAKKAVQMFKSLLIYSHTLPSKKPLSIETILEFSRDSSLVGEFYAQLLKQINGAPPDILSPLIDLLVVATASVSPPPEFIPYVQSLLARLSKSLPAPNSDQLIFAYIRFLHITFVDVSPFQALPPSQLLSAYTNATMQYGVTLYETMWNQRRRHPTFPFPYILHYAETEFLAKKCELQLGIFRKPGNMNLVETLIIESNTKDDGYLEQATPDDIGSFYKKWFRDLPGGLLNSEKALEVEKLKRGAFIEFADGLEPLVRNVLKHLIGFLRTVALSSEESKMDVANLAMVFGPGLISGGDAADPAMARRLNQASQCLQELIKNWDVSEVWPFRP
jgi:hypothetical protein